MKIIFAVGTMALALSGASPIVAQPDTAALATQISQARHENALRTRDFSWTRRTELKVKGEVKNLTTELVRYTVDGELQKTPVQQDQAKMPKRMLGRVAKKKASATKDWLADLGEMLQQYSLPSTGKLLDFLSQATWEPDGEGRRLVGTDVVQAGDRMTMWVGPHHELVKSEVKTTHEGSKVHLITDHSKSPDGLNYVARTWIRVRDKRVEMTVENFSYKRER